MSAPAPAARNAAQTARNAAAAALQVLVTGLLFLFLYRYLLATIGAVRLGIWSLVLAATNVSRLSGLGLQGSAVRFVARYLARGERTSAALVVETAWLSTALVIGAAALVGYPVIARVLAHLLDGSSLADAMALLPYALASLWINVLIGILQSGLDGCQRADLRSGATIFANIAYLLLAVAVVPLWGLVGLAMAQLAQSLFLLLWSWARLRAVLPELAPLPHRWRSSLFGEMIRYGANFQAESILAMLHDPIVKALLAHFGGLASVGYFEMASRLVLQVKQLVTAGFQVLVPVIAEHHETEPLRVRQLYAGAAELLVYVAVPVFAGLALAAPLIGRLWIGHEVSAFVWDLDFLSAAWLVNALSMPAMSANFGTGYIGWHTVAAALMASLNVVLGVVAGRLWAGEGVVAAWAVALAAGSALVLCTYHLRTQTPYVDLFSRASRRLVIAMALCGLVSALLAALPWVTILGEWPRLMVAPGAFALLTLVPLWRQPSRRRLAGVVAARWPGRRVSAA
jgi:O-antigen/teichoic acid export membrane protein